MIPQIPHRQQFGGTGRARRFVPALIILLVAAALALWGVQREARQMAEIRQMVLHLCRDAGLGKDVSKVLPTSSSAINARLAARLREICPSPDAASSVEVRVASGDTSATSAGTRSLGAASHTAIILMGDVELLGLRIKHSGDPTRIVVLGFFEPDLTAIPRS